MNYRKEILARFAGEGQGHAFYLPDLTLWFGWHDGRGTLPAEWQGLRLPEIARAMGVPAWLPIRPWQVETRGAEAIITEEAGQRTIHSTTAAGELWARWELGPDGDWWQTEYPVKTSEDLPAALELVKARSYVVDPSDLAQTKSAVRDDGALVLEIPRRPLSDLLHEFLGWSEGLMLLGQPLVGEMAGILEEKLQHLVQQVAQLPGELILSPDNLDGQFVSPRLFERHLATSYRNTADALHKEGKRLVVHVGGPIRHLLKPLVATGIDGIEGVCGPPQSNAPLGEARAITGPGLTLWGGISQDVLVDTYEEELFMTTVQQAVREAGRDGRMVLGVADRVPVDAELSRLKALPALIEQFV
jgi:hypothetical protein